MRMLLIKLRSDIWSKDKESALEDADKILALLNAQKNETVFGEFLTVCTARSREFIIGGDLERAYGLADCIHVVPDIAESQRKDLRQHRTKIVV